MRDCRSPGAPTGPSVVCTNGRCARSSCAAGFNQPAESLAFHSAELSAASLRVLSRKLDRLAGEFAELAALDAELLPREKSSVGMLLALRPWVFSMFDSLRAGAGAANTESARTKGARPAAA